MAAFAPHIEGLAPPGGFPINVPFLKGHTSAGRRIRDFDPGSTPDWPLSRDEKKNIFNRIAGQETLELAAEEAHDYKLLRRLNSGRMGEVYLATKRDMGSTPVAAKLYVGEGADTAHAKEYMLLKAIGDHPNVVKLLGNSEASKMIIIPYYGPRDLHTEVWEGSVLPESIAAHMVQDVLLGLRHIHELGIIHRDVKPENIVRKQTGEAVLLDFDNACFSSDADAMQKVVGTPGYMAPEVCLGQTYNGLVDLFGAGCVLYYVLSRNNPFFDSEGKAQSPSTVWAFDGSFISIGMDCKKFIRGLLEVEPKFRFSIKSALTNEWLRGGLGKVDPSTESVSNHSSRKLTSVLPNAPGHQRDMPAFRNQASRPPLKALGQQRDVAAPLGQTSRPLLKALGRQSGVTYPSRQTSRLTPKEGDVAVLSCHLGSPLKDSHPRAAAWGQEFFCGGGIAQQQQMYRGARGWEQRASGRKQPMYGDSRGAESRRPVGFGRALLVHTAVPSALPISVARSYYEMHATTHVSAKYGMPKCRAPLPTSGPIAPRFLPRTRP